MRRPRIHAATLLLLAALGLPGSAPPVAAQEAGAFDRVVVLGIDGADHARFARLREEGRLPNFSRLAERGGEGPLATTNPAQSPVAWAAFATGSNPGRTGIYDFLRRDPDVPGRIEIGLARKTWSDEGLPSPALRAAAPWLAGALVGLLALGLVTLLARVAGAGARSRRVAGVVAGVLAAGATGVLLDRVMGWIPPRVPKAVSLRRGVPLWSVLGEAGVASVALEAPLSFPADRARNLRLLTGLGTPDIQGHWGFYSVFTADPKSPVTPETGGLIDHLVFDGDVARARVYGPPDVTLTAAQHDRLDQVASEARMLHQAKIGVASAKRFEERVAAHASRADQLSCILEVRRDVAARRVIVRVGTGGPRPVLDLPLPESGPGPAAALPAPDDSSVDWSEPVVIEEHVWSDRVPFRFRANPLVEIAGLGRIWLETVGDETTPLRLVVTPIHIDPSQVPPNVEIAWPRDFAPSLAAEIGLFDTLGWPCLTNPVKDGMLSDAAFLAHARGLVAERRTRFNHLLAQDDWRFAFALFSTVDRVQHAFYRHVDPESPLHDPEAAKVFGGAIDEFYVHMDAVVGDILERVDDRTAVIVLSDHGFAPFRRGVNLNTWLIREGLMTGSTGGHRDVNQLFQARDFFAGVDWSRTQAYALGLGLIYLNVKGREKQGIVEPADVPAVAADLRRRLLALRDEDGSRVVREVYLGSDLYSGPTVAKWAPDLVVGFERGWRVSWQTTLGGGGRTIIEDNDQAWSGDHCSVDPSLVPGILVSNVPLRFEGASVMDIAPTVLDLLGVERPDEWDGVSHTGE